MNAGALRKALVLALASAAAGCARRPAVIYRPEWLRPAPGACVDSARVIYRTGGDQ